MSKGRHGPNGGISPAQLLQTAGALDVFGFNRLRDWQPNYLSEPRP